MSAQVVTAANSTPQATQPMVDADCIQAEKDLHEAIVAHCEIYNTMAPEIHALMKAQLLAAKSTLLLQISILKCSGCSSGTFKTKVECALREMSTIALKAEEQNKAFIALQNKTTHAYESSLERLKKGKPDSALAEASTRQVLYTIEGGVLGSVAGLSYEFGKGRATLDATALAIEEATSALKVARKTGCTVAISTCEKHLTEVVGISEELVGDIRTAAAKRGLLAGALGAFAGWGLAELVNAKSAY